jgi:hypothetical protein
VYHKLFFYSFSSSRQIGSYRHRRTSCETGYLLYFETFQVLHAENRLLQVRQSTYYFQYLLHILFLYQFHFRIFTSTNADALLQIDFLYPSASQTVDAQMLGYNNSQCIHEETKVSTVHLALHLLPRRSFPNNG